MVRVRTLPPALALLVALAACGDEDDPLGLDPSLAGTYELRWVDDRELPAVVLEGPEARVEVMAGRIALEEDGACEFAHTYRVIPEDEEEEPRVETDVDACGWGTIGTSLRLQFANGSFVDGFHEGARVGFDLFGGQLRFVYERE